MGRLIHGPVLTTVLVVRSLCVFGCWKSWMSIQKGWVEKPQKTHVKFLHFFQYHYRIHVWPIDPVGLLIFVMEKVGKDSIHGSFTGMNLFICFGCPKGVSTLIEPLLHMMLLFFPPRAMACNVILGVTCSQKATAPSVGFKFYTMDGVRRAQKGIHLDSSPHSWSLHP